MDWKTRIPAFLLWIFLVLSSIEDGNAEKRVVCYYTNWSVYRPGTAKFSPQNINPYLCTHLIYAFGGFTKDNTLKPFDKYQDIEKGGYAKFTGLKTYNRDLKTMLAIGGWNEGSSRFSPMVADPARRKDFVKNSIKFLRQNHFDGLDLDWEYPAFRDGGKPRDKNNYADLVQELREEFERESSKTGRPRLLLSMAVPAGIEYIDKGYDIPRLNDHLDFINLLSYDYHSAYEPAANHHSPLYPLEEDNEYNYDSELTIDYTIEHLLKSGATPDKIVLGIPTYGRSYTLFNEDATDIGAPADGPGEEGDATREKGYLAYYEICESIAKTDGWQVVQPNPKAMGPYAFRGNQWVGYDDEAIVRAKARYVNEKKLGGIMFWSIDNDDFRGKCHGRPYPLIEAAKEALLLGDERSDSRTKTRVSEGRKKTRIQGGQRNQGSSTGRKFITGRRSTTTESSSSARRRVNSSRTNGRSRARAKSRDNEDDEENDEEEVNSVKSAEKSRSATRGKDARKKNRLPGGGRRKQQNSGLDDETKSDEDREEPRSNKLTTPEPPTTPDPGTDFKCEDEGFFSHPRDCKKYFWCLDSGPGGLGIVAHQFTCPSGLVFNKAADSCDYPRNVVCPKTKPQQSSVTTTRAPITAATSRTTYLHKPTQRTSTPKGDSEEEYEYYDEDDDESAEDSREIEEEVRSTTTPKPYKTINRSRPTTTTTSAPTTTTTEPAKASTTRSYKTSIDKVTSFEDEEDPRVIKELIDLIKKAGGIEQLEKQLHYQEKNSGGNSDKAEENGQSTPATISRSLYERVLNRQATRIAGGFLGSLSKAQSSKGDKSEQGTSVNARSTFVNGPGGAQFEGLDQVPEVKSLRRATKHQYVTIDRQRPSTRESPNEDDEEIDEEDDDDNRDVVSSEDEAVSDSPRQKSSSRRVTPSYVNIRRSRPSTTTSENDVDQKNEDEENSDDSEEKEEEELKSQNHRITKNDEESSSPKSRYTSTQRFRSTTARRDDEKVTEKAFAKNDPTALTSASTTTTERVAPVAEKISEIPVTFPSTLQPPSRAAESSMKSDNSTKTYDSNSEEKLVTVNPETTEPSNGARLSLVENSATEILFTTVPAASLSTGNSYDSFTREPSIPAVSQPRPFGFSRRGRPTTPSGSTASIPTVVASVTEQTRSKVDSDTLRLPTLKELVGLTTTLLNDESTSKIPRSSTNSVIDTTIEVNALRDDSNDRGYEKNNVVHRDESSEGRNLGDSDAPTLEITSDSQIFDNDILGSEEIQNRSPSASFVNADDRKIDSSSNREENNDKIKTSLRRVEVPVKILDDNNGDEIAELVLLRVPENKFNSAILKPVFRVKILEREGQGDRSGIVRTKKPNNSLESSSENELSDNSRSISGDGRKGVAATFHGADTTGTSDTAQSPPRNRQRIVKARRRTRPSVANDQAEDAGNARGKASASFRKKEDPAVAKSLEKVESPVTTEVPELPESPTTLRATTIRGNRPSLPKISDSTRGFYVTRNIDETSTTAESTSADFTESTQYSSMTLNDFSDDSAPEIDLTTQKIEVATNEPDFATPRTDFTNEIVETTRPRESTIQSTTEESTETKAAITTPDYFSTLEDESNDSSVPSIAITRPSSVEEPEITTFRPWTSGQAATTDPMTSIEATTKEYSTDDTTIIGNNNADEKIAETVKNRSEILLTSENSHWRSSTVADNENTVSPPERMDNDEKIESKTGRFEVDGAAGTAATPAERNNVRRKLPIPKSAFETATVPTKRIFDENDGSAWYQTERTSLETTNLVEETTSHRGALKRGGIRYTTSAKPSSTVGSSSEIRDQSRRTTKSSGIDDYEGVSLGEQVSRVTRPSSTGPYDTRLKNTQSQESAHSNLQNRSASLPPDSRSTWRRRGNARKTTKTLETSEKTTFPTYPVTTGAYGEENRITGIGGSSLAANRKEETASGAQSSRGLPRGRHDATKSAKSSEFAYHGPDPSSPEESTAETLASTEAYGETLTTSTNSFTTYPITSPEEDTENPSDGKTTGWSENNTTEINATNEDESFETKRPTTEAYVETSPSDRDTLTSENFDNNVESESVDFELSSRNSDEDRGPRINSTEPKNYVDESSIATPTNPIDEIPESITGTPRVDYPTTNYVETTMNGDSASANSDSYSKTTGSFVTENPSDYTTVTRENSIETSASTDVYNETTGYESETVQLDNPTASPTDANDRRFYTTITIPNRAGVSSTTEAYDRIAEATESSNVTMADEFASPIENQSESRKMHETTVTDDETSTPWLYLGGSEKTAHNSSPESQFPIDSNIESGNFDSPTAGNPSSDRAEFSTTGAQDVPANDRAISRAPGAVAGKIQSSFDDERNDISTEPSVSSRASSVTIDAKIDSSLAELSSRSDAVANGAESTTPIYEKQDHSAFDSSGNIRKPEIEGKRKRTRGRVRFATFVGGFNDTSESTRRPVKQVVVRRRLAKDRYKNATRPEPDLKNWGNSTSEKRRDTNDETSSGYSTSLENKRTNKDDIREENEKIEEAMSPEDRSNDRLPEERITSPRTMRRRVVVYRGRPRSETTSTTVKPTTTTVQSSSLSGNEIVDDKRRRRRKWRKKIVLKRERADAEEEDQSIAETSDVRRALINDETIEEFHDEFGNSYVVVPPEIEGISKREDIAGEVNIFKNSGSFLRRPGTLTRNDALNRLRSKSTADTSISTSQPTSEPSPFPTIKSATDTSYEIRTNDQSVRAQEVAVTLSDPPAIDSSSTTGRVGLRKQGTKKISTTVAPQTEAPTHRRTTPIVRRRNNIGGSINDNYRVIEPHRPIRPRRPSIIDYDYYVDDEIRLVLKPELKDKLYVTQKGGIRCLDQGNFAHPTSCKKFITCARMVNGQVIGTEYTCPDKLSFDPVGGICNWSAGLGCEENNKS